MGEGNQNGVSSDKPQKRALDDNSVTPDPKRVAAANSGAETVYRLLVKDKKVGLIIGKNGNIVRKIRDESGARIRVVEGIPGCEERAVIISSKDDPSLEINSAQRALMIIHAKIIENEDPNQPNAPGLPNGICTRLLVCHSQAGSLIGRQGAIIKEMREQTSAHIKILPADELPACALSNDRVVQLVGTVEALNKALELVARQIRDNPPKERPGGLPACALRPATVGNNALPGAASLNSFLPPPAFPPLPNAGQSGLHPSRALPGARPHSPPRMPIPASGLPHGPPSMLPPSGPQQSTYY